MKVNQAKKETTLGEFITAVYDAWGQQRARGIVWFAINARQVKFLGTERFVFSKRRLN
jgi:hypothetical protein